MSKIVVFYRDSPYLEAMTLRVIPVLAVRLLLVDL